MDIIEITCKPILFKELNIHTFFRWGNSLNFKLSNEVKENAFQINQELDNPKCTYNDNDLICPIEIKTITYKVKGV